MMTFWMKTVNIDKGLESHITEILETLDKDYRDWWLLQTKFFSTTNTESVICGKFQQISSDIKNFQKLKQRKQTTLS